MQNHPAFQVTLLHNYITFGDSVNPDQAYQNVRPDLDPNYLTI